MAKAMQRNLVLKNKNKTKIRLLGSDGIVDRLEDVAHWGCVLGDMSSID